MTVRSDYYGDYFLEVFQELMKRSGAPGLNLEFVEEKYAKKIKTVRTLIFHKTQRHKELFTLFWACLHDLDHWKEMVAGNQEGKEAREFSFILSLPSVINPIIRSWLSHCLPPPVKVLSEIHINPVITYIVTKASPVFYSDLGLEICAIAFLPLGKHKAAEFAQDISGDKKDIFFEKIKTHPILDPKTAQKSLLHNAGFADDKPELFLRLGCTAVSGSLIADEIEILKDAVFLHPTEENRRILKQADGNQWNRDERRMFQNYLESKDEISSLTCGGEVCDD